MLGRRESIYSGEKPEQSYAIEGEQDDIKQNDRKMRCSLEMLLENSKPSMRGLLFATDFNNAAAQESIQGEQQHQQL